MRKGETDHKGKFWVGQRVKIHGLPTPDEILCDTGVITRIMARFVKSPNLQNNYYEVRLDKNMFKTKLITSVSVYGCNGDNLEIISP